MKQRSLPDEPPKARNLEEAQYLIDELWEQLVEKDRQANRHSGNSSQPPSGDGPGKSSGKQKKFPSAPHDNNKKTNNKPGAQAGHKGHRRSLLPTSKADVVHQHYCPDHCTCGGAVLTDQAAAYRHQIFDLPDVIPYRMEEHQLFHGHCEQCGIHHKARLPDTVSPTQMGLTCSHSSLYLRAIIT